MLLTEEETKKRIVDHLYWDSRVDASDIKMDFEDSRVRLSGTVPSFSERRAAEDDAYAVEGVRNVENNIAVSHPSTLTMPTDSEIRSNILNTLSWDSDIDAADVDVEVDAGVVTLTGSVDSYWKKQQAMEKTNSVLGVLQIFNKLTVVPSKTYIDQDIANEIMAALDRNVYVNSDTIDVEVDKGVVTLSGTVPSHHAVRTAEQTASLTAGVVDVINNLIIV